MGRRRKLNYRKVGLVIVTSVSLIIMATAGVYRSFFKEEPFDTITILDTVNVDDLTIESQLFVDWLSSLSQNELTEKQKDTLLEANLKMEYLKQPYVKEIRVSGVKFENDLASNLTELLSKYNFNVSVYLRFLDDGSTYIYHPQKTYYPASLLKVALALFLYQSDENDILHLTFEDRQLISQMIMYSDNEATLTLVNRYHLNTDGMDDSLCDDFQNFLTLNYINSQREEGQLCFMGEGFIAGECDVLDMGHLMAALYRYFETDTTNAKQLQQFFFQHDYKPALIEMSMPLCKKYGQYDGALHDMALGYVPEPFILVVMTDAGNSDYLEDPDDIMAEISTLVENNYINTHH